MIHSLLGWRPVECRYVLAHTEINLLDHKCAHGSQPPQTEIQFVVIESLRLGPDTVVPMYVRSRLVNNKVY